VLGRMRQASYGGTASMAALSTGGPQTAFADEALETALAYATSPILTKAPLKAPNATSDIAFWAQGFGAWGRFGGDGNASTLALVATGSSFTISGAPIARDALLAEAALDLAIGRNATLGVSYNGQIATRVQDHGAKGKFVWKF